MGVKWELQLSLKGVTRLLQGCFESLKKIFQELLQLCHKVITRVFHWFSDKDMKCFTGMLQSLKLFFNS